MNDDLPARVLTRRYELQWFDLDWREYQSYKTADEAIKAYRDAVAFQESLPKDSTYLWRKYRVVEFVTTIRDLTP